MEPTPIGAIVAVLGIVALVAPPALLIYVAMSLTLLGSSSAVNVTALGGASVLAAPFFSGFILLRTLLSRHGIVRSLRHLAPFTPGFWLTLAVAYGALNIFLIAPYFYGAIAVFPLSRVEAGIAKFALESLKFSSGNITQTLYAVGDVLLYASFGAMVAAPALRRTCLNAVLTLCCLHVAVSILDLVTFYTSTSFLIDWLRTANYQTWQDNSVAGLKRISGLFPEASLYAIYSMTINGILLSLVISGHRRKLTVPLFLVSVLLLAISTSSTAYLGLGIAGVLIAITALKKSILLHDLQFVRVSTYIVLSMLLLVLVAVAVYPGLIAQASNVLDEMIFKKLGSDSGVDRAQLNARAFDVFFESGGLGVGLGGARTSSFVATLLSNLGLVGTVAYGLFLAGSIMGDKRGTTTHDEAILCRAASFGMIGGLIGASIALSIFDLGSFFYILAALATPVGSVRQMLGRRRLAIRAPLQGPARPGPYGAGAMPSRSG